MIQNPQSTYKALSEPSAIRLVKLHPLKIKDSLREDRADTLSPLYVELIHTDLEEATDFTGVSYTWGSSNRQQITIFSTSLKMFITS